jgi:hypothetical protein
MLGDNTDSVAVMLLPVTFQCVGFCTAAVFLRIHVYSWPRVYTIHTCAKFDLLQNFRSYLVAIIGQSLRYKRDAWRNIWCRTDRRAIYYRIHGSFGLPMSYAFNNVPSVKYGMLRGINSDTSVIRYNFNCPILPCHNYSQLHVSDIILLIRKKQIIVDWKYKVYFCFIHS